MWPDGRQCFVNLQDRPGLLLEPTRIIDLHVSDLADQHSHLDVRRHGTPIVLHDPDGLIVLEDGGRQSRRWRPRSTRPGSAGSTGEWLVNRAIARATWPRPCNFTCGSRSDRWSGCSASSTARGATTSGCATCARTCHPTSPTGSRSWCPGATSATLEELSLRCFAWLDELLVVARGLSVTDTPW